MKQLLAFLCLLLSLSNSAASVNAATPDSLCVGFVTCAPGPEIFELYGHEAVRISGRVNGNPIDVVFNYGLFDYSSPGFIYRFVKGQTDYFSAAEPTDLFLYHYINRGSRVTERILPLSQNEAKQMLARLNDDIRPENRTYRYKYFTENCATKPLKHLEEVTAGKIKPASNISKHTYRDLLRKYNEGYPWYQFGIDLVLGSMLDRPVDGRLTSFIPLEMDSIYFGNMPQRVLYEGRGDMRRQPTSLSLSPIFVSIILLGGGILFIAKGWRSRIVYAIWFLLQGCAGLLVCYLTFFSTHEGTSPNLLAWWLNPIWLLIPITVFSSRTKRLCNCLLTADAVITGTLLLIWPFLPQCTNPAVFPLMALTILLAATRRYRPVTRIAVKTPAKGTMSD